jgi:hypothetical protein
MFRCQLCSCAVPPRTPAQRLVLARRLQRYPRRQEASVFRRDGKNHTRDDPGGTGSEIVGEVFVCPACARRQEQALHRRAHDEADRDAGRMTAPIRSA